MLIKVTPQNVQGKLLAQNLQTYECIARVDEAPECEHTVVNDIPTGFMQLLYPGTFGKYLSIDTIDRIESLKVGLTEEEFNGVSNMRELEMLHRIKELTSDIDQLALQFLEKEGVV